MSHLNFRAKNGSKQAHIDKRKMIPFENFSNSVKNWPASIIHISFISQIDSLVLQDFLKQPKNVRFHGQFSYIIGNVLIFPLHQTILRSQDWRAVTYHHQEALLQQDWDHPIQGFKNNSYYCSNEPNSNADQHF